MGRDQGCEMRRGEVYRRDWSEGVEMRGGKGPEV